MQSELRQDIVSGDWIVISPKRKKGHTEIKKRKEKRIKAPVKNCPFENPQESGNNKPILTYSNKKGWTMQIIQNKYPAFSHEKKCSRLYKSGPYQIMDAIGRHDLVITRSHDRNFPHLKKHEAEALFFAFVDYYKSLINDPCLSYVSIYHNWGTKAGASVYHPHYQIIVLPIIPPDVGHSLKGSLNYFYKHKECVHCRMIKWEKKEKKRIIYENEDAIVFAPFISREPFELRVFPKKHFPYFEDTPVKDLKKVVEALQIALMRIEKKLSDPDYNFFIHTAPLKDKAAHKHYHWHIEIVPKISISAGFELGTGIEITLVDPNEAAKILR